MLIALTCGTRDHLGVFPQSIVNKSSIIFHNIVYVLASLCISSTPHAVTLASRAVHFLKQQLLINARMNQHASIQLLSYRLIKSVPYHQIRPGYAPDKRWPSDKANHICENTL